MMEEHEDYQRGYRMMMGALQALWDIAATVAVAVSFIIVGDWIWFHPTEALAFAVKRLAIALDWLADHPRCTVVGMGMLGVFLWLLLSSYWESWKERKDAKRKAQDATHQPIHR